MKRLVHISGCDDSTTTEIEVDEAEARFLDRLKEAVNTASGGYCQPTMEVES